jgi:putative membrane protein
MDMKWMLIPAVVLAAACNTPDRSNSQQTAAVTNDSTAVAQTAPADSMNNPAAKPALDDAAILAQLAQANTQEIRGAEVAMKQAHSSAVKSLARKLEADHKANLKQGDALATKLGATPAQPDTSASAEMTALQGKSGAAFDSAFVQQEIQDHQANIDKLQNTFLPAAQSPELKALIQKTIPTLQQHLDAAQAAQKKLGSS